MYVNVFQDIEEMEWTIVLSLTNATQWIQPPVIRWLNASSATWRAPMCANVLLVSLETVSRVSLMLLLLRTVVLILVSAILMRNVYSTMKGTAMSVYANQDPSAMDKTDAMCRILLGVLDAQCTPIAPSPQAEAEDSPVNAMLAITAMDMSVRL